MIRRKWAVRAYEATGKQHGTNEDLYWFRKNAEKYAALANVYNAHFQAPCQFVAEER